MEGIMDIPCRISEKNSLNKNIDVTNRIFSPEIPYIQYEHLAERKQSLPPSPSYVGAESFDWVLCYSDDIYRHWQRIERTRMVVKGYPNMSIIRPLFIDILRDLQTNYGLANTTLHLAVYIVDNFLSRNSPAAPLKFIVITSLLVAAKVEDVEIKMPRFVEINQTILNNKFSLIGFRKLEAKILMCMDFELTVPTVATFADFFSRVSVVLDDFHIYQRICTNINSPRPQTVSSVPGEHTIHPLFERYDEMLAAVNQLLNRLIDLTLDSVILLNVLPSRKAAACIAAARKLYNVQPVWTPYLELQSSYSESEIRPIMDAVISIYDLHAINDSSSGSSLAKDSCLGNDTSSVSIDASI